MVIFGQIVVGPPGAGKTTYCYGMQQMCHALQRKAIVVNLDPANDEVPYDCSIDIRSLISVEEVMEQYGLGPNGALMFCMEFLLKNKDWLESRLGDYMEHYVLVDLPGQVELYTHHSALLNLLNSLRKFCDTRFTVVHLVDSVLCSDASKYISALLVSLSGQVLLDYPHVNCLTKIDLLRHHSKDLAFRLEYYAEVQDLGQLLRYLDETVPTATHPMETKYRRLQAEICDLVQDFNLVAFLPLDINDKKSVLQVLKHVDTANGFLLGDIMQSDPAGLFKIAIGPALGLLEETFGELQERYIDVDEHLEEET